MGINVGAEGINLKSTRAVAGWRRCSDETGANKSEISLATRGALYEAGKESLGNVGKGKSTAEQRVCQCGEGA